MNLRILSAALTVVGVLVSPASQAEKVQFPLNPLALSQQKAQTIQCVNQMVRILHGAEIWAMDNADQPPASLQFLTNELGKPSFLYCPAVFHSSIPTNWADVDWAAIDYTWSAVGNWNDPTNVVCTCRAHTNLGRAEGSVMNNGYRAGWPLLSASPMNVYATPGEEARLELRLAPDTTLPVSYQWRGNWIEYVTNVTQEIDPNDATRTYWVTNVQTTFAGTNLPGATNAFLTLAGLRTNDAEWYSVTISNSIGVAQSHQTRVSVQSSYAGMATNETWSTASCANNLYMVYLSARLMDDQGTGWLPGDLAEMTNHWGEPIFGWPLALYCPADTNRTPPATWAEVKFDDTSYEIVPGTRSSGYEVFCRCRVHGYYMSVDGTRMVNPLFTGINKEPGGSVSATFRPFAGRDNVLESTEDWHTWTTIQTYGPAPAEIRLTEPAGAGQKFYRLRKK